MTSSLVGSEMCIRDRPFCSAIVGLASSLLDTLCRRFPWALAMRILCCNLCFCLFGMTLLGSNVSVASCPGAGMMTSMTNLVSRNLFGLYGQCPRRGGPSISSWPVLSCSSPFRVGRAFVLDFAPGGAV
eukprot:8938169-Prorocentrum_lima.AAC.1